MYVVSKRLDLKSLAARDRGTSEVVLNQLTTDINMEIKGISVHLRRLQDTVKQRKSGVADNQFTQQHSETVVGTLNTQLKSATKTFKSILEQRNAVCEARGFILVFICAI